MSQLDTFARAALRSALLWGTLLTLGFYGALGAAEEWVNPYALRCLTGRPEAYACVAMFWVAAASLAVKGIDLARQRVVWSRTRLDSASRGKTYAAAAQLLFDTLQQLPRRYQGTYLYARLSDALRYIVRTGSHESLDAELRNLAELDAVRMHASYGLPRFMSWAIPAVGSLGTVLGIAAAVTQLAEATPTESIAGVTEGLGLALDTTALALGLSIVLVCLKFVCEQQEQQLLLAVDERVSRELNDHLGALAMPAVSQLEQLRKLTESVVAATEKLSQRQSLPGAPDAAAPTGELLESIVSRAVAKAVTGQPVVAAGGSGPGMLDEAGLTNLNQVQQALQQIANYFSRQQAAQLRESEVILQLAEFIHQGTPGVPPRKSAGAIPGKLGESLAGLMKSE